MFSHQSKYIRVVQCFHAPSSMLSMQILFLLFNALTSISSVQLRNAILVLVVQCFLIKANIFVLFRAFMRFHQFNQYESCSCCSMRLHQFYQCSYAMQFFFLFLNFFFIFVRVAFVLYNNQLFTFLTTSYSCFSPVRFFHAKRCYYVLFM